MKKLLLYIPITLLFIACGGVKKTQKAVNSGNYVSAINEALQNLVSNKTKKGHQPYILLLEDAFRKNTERELNNITLLKKNGNESSYESIYNNYVNLRNIQEKIKPLLPLRIAEENRHAQFTFNDYENDIVDYKENLSKYLYDKAEYILSNATSKSDYRKAYNDFVRLNKINPDFEDTYQKIEEANIKGIDHIEVTLLNNSNQIIPKQLSEELLNFNPYGLDNLWTRYYTAPQSNMPYDYLLEVSFDAINISPEQIREKEIIQEKQIKDGYKYAVDKHGNTVKDSLGNKIKVDKFKTVICHFQKFTQFKSVSVVGTVRYIDLHTNEQVNTYPLLSEFVFEHEYANSRGDKRALETDYISLLDQSALPFPTNEQMVYDAGEDIKERLKIILKRHQFKH